MFIPIVPFLAGRHRQITEREETQTMVKEISCRGAGIDCEFLIRSEQMDELLGFVKEHANT